MNEFKTKNITFFLILFIPLKIGSCDSVHIGLSAEPITADVSGVSSSISYSSVASSMWEDLAASIPARMNSEAGKGLGRAADLPDPILSCFCPHEKTLCGYLSPSCTAPHALFLLFCGCNLSTAALQLLCVLSMNLCSMSYMPRI